MGYPNVTVPDDAWQNYDIDGSAPRLRAVITLNGKIDLYLTAICVENLGEPDGGLWQEAVNAEDTDDLRCLYEIEGKDGPFQTVRIGGAGDNREYVVFAVTS